MMTDEEVEDFLAHYGVKGMRWGVRKDRDKSTKLSSDRATTKVTRKVISDHNSMSNKEFRGRYRVSKKTYAKRVEKYGDPYARKMKKRRKQGPIRKATRSLTPYQKVRLTQATALAALYLVARHQNAKLSSLPTDPYRPYRYTGDYIDTTVRVVDIAGALPKGR